MAGTTGLEPATSAVTAKRKRVTNRKQGATDDIFSALRNPWELLLHPYRTHDLCPADLCLTADLLFELKIDRGRAIPCSNSLNAQLQELFFINSVKRS